jgi:hypothetical protein
MLSEKEYQSEYGTRLVTGEMYSAYHRIDTIQRKDGTIIRELIAARPGDLTNAVMVGEVYNPKCNLCWLNVAHSEAAHNEQVNQ